MVNASPKVLQKGGPTWLWLKGEGSVSSFIYRERGKGGEGDRQERDEREMPHGLKNGIIEFNGTWYHQGRMFCLGRHLEGLLVVVVVLLGWCSL